MDRWLTLGRSFEGKDRANWLSWFVDHPDVVGGVGLQVSDGGAVIVAATMLDGIRRQGAKLLGSVLYCRTRSWPAFEVQAILAELALANSSIGLVTCVELACGLAVTG